MNQEVMELERDLGALDLVEILRLISQRHPGKVVFTSAMGQEDQVISDVIWRNHLDIRVATLDTGRLFQETYSLIEDTRAQYGQKIEIYFPAASDVENLTSSKGLFSFYDSVENRKECCNIRKVLPLKRALSGCEVWVTGVRSEQSKNRASMTRVEWDAVHGLIKVNPLIDWTLDQVKVHLKENNVPESPLHRKGYVSIGCAPCTRAIEPGEDARAGRWWWESSKKECGLHG